MDILVTWLAGVAFLAAVALLVVGTIVARVVPVADETRVDADPARLERWLGEALAAARLPVQRHEPGHLVVVLRRCPTWVVVPVVLLFPVGLLFLLLKEEVRLDVYLFAERGRTVVRAAGRSTRRVAEVVGEAVALAPTRTR